MWHKLSISSDQDEHLKSALGTLRLPKIVGFQVKDNTLYIYHKPKEGLEKIPFGSNKVEYIFQFIKSWLASIEYPREPDCDGSCGKGFEVFVYASGGYCDLVNDIAAEKGDCNAITFDGWAITIVVKPYWVEYHK